MTSLDTKKQCSHNFVGEKIKKQRREREYVGYSKYDVATLENEELKIFYTKCGELK